MAELSIFIDESGDFGDYEPHAPFYLMTLVFHDQTVDISGGIEHLKKQVVELGFDREHAVHTGPLVRRKSEDTFFNGARTFKKNYWRPMERKRLG